MKPYEFYKRQDIRKEIIKLAKNREVAVKFGDKGFGKRPESIQFENDILELAKQGATSFHVSEEIWQDPMQLESGMSRKSLDELRIGWDFLMDVDSKNLELSKLATCLLIEALKFHGIKNLYVKYSGNLGFHIAVPFNSFPEKINSIESRLVFPEANRIIVSYLKEMIKPVLSSRILEKYNIEQLVKLSDKKKDLILKNNIFDPFPVVDVDTVLISSRHLYRMPYSYHEKSGLISIPLNLDDIENFNKDEAKPEKVKINLKFLEHSEKNEAHRLVIQAYDQYSKHNREIETKVEKEFNIPKVPMKVEHFPPCIKSLLKGISQDGRKRSVFILITFLRNVGWSSEDIEKLLQTWNEKNYEKLREGYVKSQASWHKKQSSVIISPNCSNENYYKSLNVCNPDHFCKFIKNPVNYPFKKIKMLKQK